MTMFTEPTLLDIEQQWRYNRDSFVSEIYKDSGLTAAEWAWLKYPSFWKQNNPPLRNDGKAWLTWLSENSNTGLYKTQVQTAIEQHAYNDEEDLFNILKREVKSKSGFTSMELEKVVSSLLNVKSMMHKNKNGENTVDAVLALGDKTVLNLFLERALMHGLSFDDHITGNSLLHRSVYHNNSIVVKTLIDAGLNQDHKNKAGLTAKELALELDSKKALQGFKNTSPLVSSKLQKKITPSKTSTQMDLF